MTHEESSPAASASEPLPPTRGHLSEPSRSISTYGLLVGHMRTPQTDGRRTSCRPIATDALAVTGSFGGTRQDWTPSLLRERRSQLASEDVGRNVQAVLARSELAGSATALARRDEAQLAQD